MKKMKKLLRAKRAFSPVIAALILMLLAVAAGVVVYSYTMGWIGGATKTPGGQQGELQFDSLYGDATNNKIKMYVRNTGGKDLTLDGTAIYVDGVAYANTTSFTTSSLTVNSNTYLEVTVTMSAGYFYEVTVSCKDGTTVSQAVEGE